MVRGVHRAPTPTLVAGMGTAGAAGKWGGCIAASGGAAPSVLVPTPAMVAGGGPGASDMPEVTRFDSDRGKITVFEG